jgi:hypothetical protein
MVMVVIAPPPPRNQKKSSAIILQPSNFRDTRQGVVISTRTSVFSRTSMISTIHKCDVHMNNVIFTRIV